ncbi:hypothetical protein F5Y10DRAFT_235275 [Nemania abortiva]|nr:hypothetical protein F5Y10DRAFT_235275 [Nemania abortiva]
MSDESDQSDREDDLSSDVDSEIEEDSDESGTDQGDGFFDIEAEESDGDEYYDPHYIDLGPEVRFPQFSGLPPELRAMVWAAVDPHLQSKGRVLDFQAITNISPQHDYEGNDIWDSATLAGQTAPARTVLAINKETRHMALTYYPDVIRFRDGRYDVRFNSVRDIILLRGARHLVNAIGLESWCDKIKYLALERDDFWDPREGPLFGPFYTPPPSCRNLEAVFLCYEATGDMGRRNLGWAVSKTSRQFHVKTSKIRPGLGENWESVYCWPDITLGRQHLADLLSRDLRKEFPSNPTCTVGSLPCWPMAEFIGGFRMYLEAKRYDEYIKRGRTGTPPPSKYNWIDGTGLDSDPEQDDFESEEDEYEIGDFVVDDGDGVDSHDESEDEGEDEDEDGNDEAAQFDQDPDDFNGFSPLEGSDDDEVAGALPNALAVTFDYESPEDYASDTPSLEEARGATRQSGRRKRRIVSSDDEDGDKNGDASIAESRPRLKKRARVVLSDSEDEEAGGESAEPEAEIPSRLKKRARVVLSDSEDEEGEEDQPSKRGVAEGVEDEDEDEDEKEDEEDEEEEYEEDEEDEEEAQASKPLSLMQRLRQFRSDVRVSPENGSPNSAEEDDGEEQYEDYEERGFSDAEFPESAEEDNEMDGW